MKYNNYIGIMIAAAGMLSAASCSDFNDYNTAYTDSNAYANQTLWQNISSNENLSTFAGLVKKAGFDDELNTSHYYTVWAPVNSALTNSEYLTADSTTLLERFIQNHIADYNYVASGTVSQRVNTLNSKAYNFAGTTGSYTFNDVSLTETTIPSINGMLYTLNGAAEYLPNIHDYIYEIEGCDSIASYLKNYEYSVLDESSSVAGPVVDGKPTYVDSVMVEYNNLLNNLRAYVTSEDSSYSMIIPTNEAWVKQYEKVSKYMNYIGTTTVQDLSTTTSTSSIPTKTVSVSNAYYKDSLTKMGIVYPLFFNNNDVYNRWTVDETQECTDTIYTTTRYKLSNPKEILSYATSKEKMSNGWAYKVDSLAMYSWDYFAPEIDVKPWAYVARTLPQLDSDQRYTYSFNSNDPEEVQFWRDSLGYYEPGTSITYTLVQAASTYTKPELDIYLPDVLSTTYNFYCVFVPNLDGYTSYVGWPNKVDFTLSYCNSSGSLAEWKFSSDGAQNPKKSEPFINDPTKIDTMYIGQFTFPVAYSALGDDYCPNIKITSPFTVFSADAKVYARDLRIAAIIMRPAEYDEFLGNNQEEEEE